LKAPEKVPGPGSFLLAKILCTLEGLRTIRIKRIVSRYEVAIEGEGTPSELDVKVPPFDAEGPPGPSGIEVRGMGFSLGVGSLKRAMDVVKAADTVLGFDVRIRESLNVGCVRDDTIPRFEARGVLAVSNAGYVAVGYGRDVPLVRPFRRPFVFGGAVGEEPFRNLFRALREADSLSR